MPLELRRLAGAFVELQQARHEADYDLGRDFTRREVIDLVETAEQAVADLEVVRRTDIGKAFLVSLLVGGKLRR